MREICSVGWTICVLHLSSWLNLYSSSCPQYQTSICQSRRATSKIFEGCCCTLSLLKYTSCKLIRSSQPLHTDSFCDILAFMMQSAAASGGDISISSCASVYNEIQKRRPDLLEILAKDDWNLDRYDNITCTLPTTYLFEVRALLFPHNVGPFCFTVATTS